jgi:hypothetical protein
MGIYKPTQHHWFHRTWFELWFLPQEELKCEYYRIRHRFIEDPDNYIETTLNKDFDFGHYLKLCLAHSCAHIIEVCPSDWFALWLSFSGVFISYYFFPEASLVIFFILEGLMVSPYPPAPAHRPLPGRHAHSGASCRFCARASCRATSCASAATWSPRPRAPRRCPTRRRWHRC